MVKFINKWAYGYVDDLIDPIKHEVRSTCVSTYLKPVQKVLLNVQIFKLTPTPRRLTEQLLLIAILVHNTFHISHYLTVRIFLTSCDIKSKRSESDFFHPLSSLGLSVHIN